MRCSIALLASCIATLCVCLQVTETTINLKGHCACLIERQAPYCAMIKHEWGTSYFTLLPSLNQVLEVNSSNGNAHHWVKCE
jgi:hypothetical protein